MQRVKYSVAAMGTGKDPSWNCSYLFSLAGPAERTEVRLSDAKPKHAKARVAWTVRKPTSRRPDARA